MRIESNMYWPFLLPYVSMVIGLYVFHSAWLAFILYHISIILCTKKSDWKLLLKGWNTLYAVLAVFFGLAGGVVLYLLAPYAHAQETIRATLPLLGLQGFAWLLFVLYHSLVNPWFEEVFWRRHAHWSTHIIFAGYHALVLALFLDWYWIILALLILLIASVLWRYWYKKYEGLLLPVLSHMAADASIMIVVYVLSLQ